MKLTTAAAALITPSMMHTQGFGFCPRHISPAYARGKGGGGLCLL